jgi:hypothetical protein
MSPTLTKQQASIFLNIIESLTAYLESRILYHNVALGIIDLDDFEPQEERSQSTNATVFERRRAVIHIAYGDPELTFKRIQVMNNALRYILKIRFSDNPDLSKARGVLHTALVANTLVSQSHYKHYQSYKQNKLSGMGTLSALWNRTWLQSRSQNVLVNAIALIDAAIPKKSAGAVNIRKQR